MPKQDAGMPDYDFRTQRLFVPDDLANGADLDVSREASHYLASVLRMREIGRAHV